MQVSLLGLVMNFINILNPKEWGYNSNVELENLNKENDLGAQVEKRVSALKKLNPDSGVHGTVEFELVHGHDDLAVKGRWCQPTLTLM